MASLQSEVRAAERYVAHTVFGMVHVVVLVAKTVQATIILI